MLNPVPVDKHVKAKKHPDLKDFGKPSCKLEDSIKRIPSFKALRVLSMSLISIVAGNLPAFSAEVVPPEKTPVSVTVDLPLLSAVIWRGQVTNIEPLLEPALTVGKGGFSINIQEYVNLTKASTIHAPETDITLTYSQKIQFLETSFGWSEFLYSNQTYSDAAGNRVALPGTRELFMSAGIPELPGSPSITVCHDFKEINGTYYALGTTYNKSFNNGNINFGLSGSVGYGSAAYNKGYFGINNAAFNDMTLGITASIKASHNLKVIPLVQYVTLLDSAIRNAAKSLYKDNQQVVYSLRLSYSL